MSHGTAYGLALHAELERRLDRQGQVNPGQVYATVERLRTAGLVAAAGTSTDGLPLYRATSAGRTVAAEWLDAPTPSSAPRWSEMVDQVILACTLPGYDGASLIGKYREEWCRFRSSTRTSDRLAGNARSRLTQAALEWLDDAEAALQAATSVSVPFRDARPRRGRPSGRDRA